MSFFSSDEKREFDLVPEGNHKVFLHAVTVDDSKDPVRLTVQYKLENNRRLFQNFRINDGGKKWMTWQLGVLGLSAEARSLVADGNTATPKEIGAAYVEAASKHLGRVVEVAVVHSEWQGKKKEDVKVVTGLPEDIDVALGVDHTATDTF